MALVAYRLRTVARRRWRSYLGIAVLIGVAGGIGLFAIAGARRTQSAYPRFLRSVNASTMAVDPTTGDNRIDITDPDNLLARIARFPEVVKASSYIAFTTAEVVDGKPFLQHSFEALGSVDGRFFDQDRFTALQGRLPDPSRVDEVAVNETAAALYGYRVGQRLHLGTYSDEQANDPSFFDNPTPPKQSDDVTVVGVGVFPEEVVQDDYDRSALVLFTPAYTRAHASLTTYAWEGLVLAHGDADIPRVKAEYATLLTAATAAEGAPDAPSQADPPQFTRITSVDEFHTLQSMRPTSTALAAFGLIALVAALLLGAQAISRQLRFERDERDTLRALGTSPGRAIVVSIVPIAITIVAGAVLAVGLAVAASPAMPIGPVGRVEVHPGVDVDLAALGLGALALVVLLGTLAAVVAWREAPQRVLGRARRARRSRIVAAAAGAGMSPPAVTGLRLAFEPGEGPTAVPVRSVMASVAIAVAALVAALTFGASLNGLVAHPRLYGWDWGATMWMNGGYGNVDRAAATEAFGGDPNITGWSDAYFGSNLVDDHSIPVLGMEPGSAVVPPIASGRAVEASDEIVLGGATLATLHKHVGDSVSIGRGDTAKVLRIVGTAVLPTIGVVHGEHTSLGVGAIVVPELVPGSGRDQETAASPPDGAPDGGNVAFIRLRPGVDQDAELAKLRDDVGQVGGGFQDAVVAAVHRPAEIVNANDAGSSPALLAGALVLASVLSLGLALVSAVRRRRRDLALVKSLGFTRRQVAAAVAWQATATAIVAVIVGIPAGLIVGRWSWILFAGQLDVVPHAQLPVGTVALLVLGAFVVANIVATIPGRVARRVQPALVLRGE